MAKVIYMQDTVTGKRQAVFTVDAREILKSKNPRYRVSSDQGARAVSQEPATIQVEKPEDKLTPSDVRTVAPRAGVRGGDLSPGGRPTAQPGAIQPFDEVVAEAEASAGPVVIEPAPPSSSFEPGAAAVSDSLTHAQPTALGATAPDKGEGFLG